MTKSTFIWDKYKISRDQISSTHFVTILIHKKVSFQIKSLWNLRIIFKLFFESIHITYNINDIASWFFHWFNKYVIHVSMKIFVRIWKRFWKGNWIYNRSLLAVFVLFSLFFVCWKRGSLLSMIQYHLSQTIEQLYLTYI